MGGVECGDLTSELQFADDARIRNHHQTIDYMEVTKIMAGKMTFTLLDHSNEQSTVQLYTPDLDGTNIGQYTDDNLGGHLGDMRLAISGLTEMNHLRRSVVALQLVDAASLPANASAQRERKALITFRDLVTAKLYSLTIPGFNMVGAEAGTDILDIDVPQWVAFRTAFEANHRSELGNNIQMISAKHVGRAS